ncbi:putative protein OS=Streptomyces microflavus OX=1919 GN=Smic_35090 PE=4 SV=1 [Streptomyces microflavus]
MLRAAAVRRFRHRIPRRPHDGHEGYGRKGIHRFRVTAGHCAGGRDVLAYFPPVSLPEGRAPGVPGGPDALGLLFR